MDTENAALTGAPNDGSCPEVVDNSILPAVTMPTTETGLCFQREANELPTETMASPPPADDQVVALWIHGRSPHTRRAYAGDVKRWRAWHGLSFHEVTLASCQGFADSLDGLAPASRYRILSSVKSLLAFAHRTGYLPVDVGRALRLPAARDRLAERILSEAEIHRMLTLEPDPRNYAVLKLLYASGARASELVAICWRDLQPNGDGGQVALFGKGGKTRAVQLPASVWTLLQQLPAPHAAGAPLFRSQKGGGHLSTQALFGIVRAAAARAGIEQNVSPHWLRHAHASHALDRGAPIHLVQATLGHAGITTTGRYLHARPTDSSSMYLPL